MRCLYSLISLSYPTLLYRGNETVRQLGENPCSYVCTTPILILKIPTVTRCMLYFSPADGGGYDATGGEGRWTAQRSYCQSPPPAPCCPLGGGGGGRPGVFLVDDRVVVLMPQLVKDSELRLTSRFEPKSGVIVVA